MKFLFLFFILIIYQIRANAGQSFTLEDGSVLFANINLNTISHDKVIIRHCDKPSAILNNEKLKPFSCDNKKDGGLENVVPINSFVEQLFRNIYLSDFLHLESRYLEKTCNEWWTIRQPEWKKVLELYQVKKHKLSTSSKDQPCPAWYTEYYKTNSYLFKLDARINTILNFLKLKNFHYNLQLFKSQKNTQYHNDIIALQKTIKFFDPKALKMCGQRGLLEERINDCRKNDNSSIENFKLISVNNKLEKFYIDSKSNLIWMDVMRNNDYMWNKAKSKYVCGNKNPYLKNILNNKNISWRLPTEQDFVRAKKNGLNKVFKWISLFEVWTSSSWKDKSDQWSETISRSYGVRSFSVFKNSESEELFFKRLDKENEMFFDNKGFVLYNHGKSSYKVYHFVTCVAEWVEPSNNQNNNITL